MLRQIFKQLWFYRRSNAWLFIELVVIIAASWFIVNETWTSTYRIGNVPDGYDPEGVYCVYLTDLTSDRNGYDPEAASLEAQRENLRRFGDALRAMPEVLCASPISTGHPGDGVHSMAMVNIDSVTTMMFTTDGQMEDTPGSIIITKDMADYLFPGQNPVGRTLSDSEKLTNMNYTEPIAGVIGSMRGAGYSDDIPYMLQNVADMVGDNGGDQMYAFRLKPGVDGDRFLEKASREWRKTLQFGNYRVQDVYSFEDRVDSVVRIEVLDKLFIWKALWLFMIVNVLLAVASTGWLRMEERRGEIGVRRAMGGSPRRILLHYMQEVWVTFAAAAVIGILITVNIILIGKINIVAPDNQHGMMPLNAADFPLLFDPTVHFLAVEGIVLGLLLLAVTAAILIPAAGALRRPPVEALRDE